MSLDVVRAWKDEEYRKSLNTEELAQLPENPAGAFELSEAELDSVYGTGQGKGVSQQQQQQHHHHRAGSKEFFATNAVICLQTVAVAFCVSIGSDCQ